MSPITKATSQTASLSSFLTAKTATGKKTQETTESPLQRQSATNTLVITAAIAVPRSSSRWAPALMIVVFLRTALSALFEVR